MSQIKLLHSGGNGVSIVAPDSNPASDRTLKLPSDGDGTILTTNSATGKILQVVSTTKVNDFATTSSSFVDINGLSRTITPTAASSKIYVVCTIHSGGASSSYPAFNLLRGSTILGQGSYGTSNKTPCTFGGYVESASITTMLSHNFLDNPTYNVGDTLTYKIQLASRYNNYEVTVNRNNTGANQTYTLAGTSNLTLMEVAA